jgi:hypothetical protein
MKNILLAVFALALAVTAFAQDKTVTVAGILMDKACAVDMKMDAKGHDKDCALMPDCIKSGYGIVTADGKFVKLDEKGNKDALAWVKATKLKTNLQVTATGTMDKDVLKVATLK